MELEKIDVYDIIIDFENYLENVNILCKYNIKTDCKSFSFSNKDIEFLVDNDNIYNLNRYLNNELEYLKSDEDLLIFKSCLDILKNVFDFYNFYKKNNIVLKNCGNCLHLIGEECGITGEEVYEHYVRNCFQSKK